jgi:hypothetical protein
MAALHRREMLRVMLGGAVVAAAGLALLPESAESAPLTISKRLPAPTENLVEEAVVVVRRRRWGRGEVMLVAPGTPRLSLALGLALIAGRWLTLGAGPAFGSFWLRRSALSALSLNDLTLAAGKLAVG